MIEEFSVKARIQVRWRDMDPMGHVNNATYFTYWEMARAAYIDQAFEVAEPGVTTFLVASIRCDFYRPVTTREDLEVGIRLARVGKTSFDFDYELRNLSGQRLATASSVQVLFDPRSKKNVVIKNSWLERVVKVEGRYPDRKVD